MCSCYHLPLPSIRIKGKKKVKFRGRLADERVSSELMEHSPKGELFHPALTLIILYEEEKFLDLVQERECKPAILIFH